MNLRKSLDKADKLLDQGWYSEAISEYGRILEQLFKELYRKYLPHLPYSSKEKAVNYEEEREKSTSKFTIGEWVGLFKCAHIFDFISQEKSGRSKGFIFFTTTMLNTMIDLRNISIHPTSRSEKYVIRKVARFAESRVRCIFYEPNE